MASFFSCSNTEEPDYPAVASNVSNRILVDILDSEGNSLIDNEAVMTGLSFVGKDGSSRPFHIVEIDKEKLITTNFPLPMESAMSYSADRKEGYGESDLTVNINKLRFKLKGKFQYTCTNPNTEMYGGNGISIIGIDTSDSNVFMNEDANSLKVTIKITSY
jgi:hypothetical protein